MSATAVQPPRELPWTRRLGLFAAVSVGLHGMALLWLNHRPPRSTTTARPPLELVVVEVQKPPEPPKPVPAPPRPLKPPPITVARAEKPPPRTRLPPPPNEPPPPEAPKAPVVVGLTLSSTTTAGTFSAPVGNTAYGRVGPTAVAPQAVKPSSAPHYAPSYQVDTGPQPLGDIRAEYPNEVRRDEIEGSVVLSVSIDASGNVAQVRVVKGLDPRLDALAVETLKRSHWRPAVLKGQPVGTEIKYNFRFELSR